MQTQHLKSSRSRLLSSREPHVLIVFTAVTHALLSGFRECQSSAVPGHIWSPSIRRAASSNMSGMLRAKIRVCIRDELCALLRKQSTVPKRSSILLLPNSVNPKAAFSNLTTLPSYLDRDACHIRHRLHCCSGHTTSTKHDIDLEY